MALRVPKLSQILSQSDHQLRERDFTTMCSRCGEDRRIIDCKTEVRAEVRSYRCSSCGELLVLVGHPSDRPISGDGCRTGDWWSIRPVGELFVELGRSRLRILPSGGAPIFGEPML
jgi:predicted RNA-binding Zn-ribbon protein involved in translation (DUF1610 family)